VSNNYILLGLRPAEYEILFGESPPAGEVLIGALVSGRDLSRGVHRWKMQERPDPLSHKHRLSILKEIQATLSSKETSRELQKTQTEAQQRRIAKLAQEVNRYRKRIDEFQQWCDGLSWLQRGIARVFRLTWRF